jgi:protein-S-isoprenylcysteine O-methyltransferase Ste14
MGLLVGFAALGYFEAKARAEEVWLMERYPDYRRYALTVRRRVL